MMPISILIDYDGWEGLLTEKGAISRKGREILREAHRVQASSWHRNYEWKHFTRQARGLYGYKPRKKSYAGRKRRAGSKGRVVDGGLVDLVYTGLLREKALAIPQIKAFPTRGRAIMHAPSYASIRPRGDKPNLGNEMTATTVAERSDLEGLMRAVLDSEFKNLRTRRKIHISA